MLNVNILDGVVLVILQIGRDIHVFGIASIENLRLIEYAKRCVAFVGTAGIQDVSRYATCASSSGNNRVGTLFDNQHLGAILRVDIAIKQHIVITEIKVTTESVGNDGEHIYIGVLGQRIIAFIITIHLVA